MAKVEWVVTSYLLVISVLVLLNGRIGDIKGKYKVFKIGIFIFTIGSICSGISKDITLLIISRVIQGIGASCTMAVIMGIITSIYKEGEGRGKALGTMIGPSIGGILASIRWDLIFWINVPIGIINLIVASKVFNKDNSVINEKIDFRGTIAFGIFIVSLILSVTKGEFIGYTNKYILCGLLISLIGLIIFIYLQKTVKSPVLDLNLFKNRLFATSIICNF
ncbi:MFS transporter [Clostridium sp. Ade.TY]|uniref:MFS transporter n=1 Tax=Clostridium sp. Ade.TY TaxID=1391647 RepID=UPI000406DBFF|nr:MFS transporter [Clostridium sp. Ade.TY]